jgi:hypothetical protein
MHPEILRELGAQRGSEMRARAHRARLAKVARKELRAGRGTADVFVAPAVPDFVDGSFLVTTADEAEAPKARRLPAGRHAA